MSATVLRLSLHPSSRATKDNKRCLKIADEYGEVRSYRTFDSSVTSISVIVPRAAKTQLSLGHREKVGGPLTWASPVSVDPRAELLNDPARDIRVTASQDFETIEAAEAFLASGQPASRAAVEVSEEEPEPPEYRSPTQPIVVEDAEEETPTTVPPDAPPPIRRPSPPATPVTTTTTPKPAETTTTEPPSE